MAKAIFERTTPRVESFKDALGRSYSEGNMPDENVGNHNIPIYKGDEPRRLTASKDGAEVGYTDFYREPERWGRDIFNPGQLEVRQDVKVGFMETVPALRKTGVGRQMIDYLERTTPPGQELNMGTVIHPGSEKIARDMADKHNTGSSRRIKYKFF